MKTTVGKLKQIIKEAIEFPDFDALEPIPEERVRMQYVVAWESALDAGGPAGAEIELGDCNWALGDNDELYAWLDGADPSTGSKWTPTTGWEPLRGWAE